MPTIPPDIDAQRPRGRVYLVGAGPGDAGLITLRGVECLQRADAVLYDYLVNPQILRHVRRGAEAVCLGRHGHGRVVSQAEINLDLVERAARGECVVRLKGGDPSVFGRLAEEAEALHSAGIDYEVVPGVTAALAAASYTGIPLTHRDHASAVAFVTGQQSSATPSDIDFRSLAAFPGTLVVYMGVTTAAHWTAALIAGGKPAGTPVAIVRRATLPDQRLWTCRLDEVAARLVEQSIRPPILAVVGEVAALGGHLDWFTRRSLFGKTVLVTRPADQADALRATLEELGAQVLVQPVIAISPAADRAALVATIERTGQFDWLVFSSANGVRHFLDALLEVADVRRLGKAQLAAVGPGTVEALAEYRLTADLVPEEHRAEGLADALADCVSGRRVLLVRGSRGRDVLAERLSAAGAEVEQIVAYESADVSAADAEIRIAVDSGRIDWVTVTSSAIARSVVRLFGDSLRRCRLASISPLTTGTLGELGFRVAAEASPHSMSALVQAIIAAEADD
jgi:uroporphyrinogen III methyltransferase/synthase